jgi:hypothetical protein
VPLAPEFVVRHSRRFPTAERTWPQLLQTVGARRLSRQSCRKREPANPLSGDDINVSEIAVAKTRSAHYNMRAMFERGQDVGLGAIRFGVFDENVARIDERLRG